MSYRERDRSSGDEPNYIPVGRNMNEIYQTFDQPFEVYIGHSAPEQGQRRRSTTNVQPHTSPPRHRPRTISVGNTGLTTHSTFEEDFLTYINKDFSPINPDSRVNVVAGHNPSGGEGAHWDGTKRTPNQLSGEKLQINSGGHKSSIYSDPNRESSIYATIPDYPGGQPTYSLHDQQQGPLVGFSQLAGLQPSQPRRDPSLKEVDDIYLHPKQVDAFRK